MFKKIMVTFVLIASVTLMVACGKTSYTVTFDSQGGTAVSELVVEDGSAVAEPTDPTRAAVGDDSAWSFTGWYTTADATTMFDFASEITEDITLYAGWSQQLVVRFNTKTTETIQSILLPVTGGSVTEPADPTKADFTFGGWYFGKPGKTWLEDEAVTFPLAVTEAVQLYAYWVPVNSKTADWSDGETYKNSFTELDADPILNPLTYHWSHESALMDYISTNLYGTDVNWDQAITDGLATEKGDFSTIDETNIGALVRENVLYGAAEFPIAVGGEFDGESGVDQDGNYSEAISREISAYTYRYTLRDDIYWEDGTNVTADDYYYSYFQYIDNVQNNFRASSYYPNADRSSGMKVVGSRGYFLQGTEIGLGESSANPLAGDYGYAELTAYAGPNPIPAYAAYSGYAIGDIFGGASTTYITEAQLNSFGYELGDEDVALVSDAAELFGFPADSHWLVDMDLICDIVANPNYVGAIGETWPVVAKEDVGFKVIDDYTFEMTFEVPVSHSSAISNGDFKLVHPATYAASLDSEGTNSTYGTSLTKPLSYGPYVLKSWDTGQKIVFNKNYMSFMQNYFNYKSISFEFYPNVDSRVTAFKQGLLSSTSLNQTYYNEFLEDPNRKSYYDGYPQYLLFNAAEYEGQDLAVRDVIKEQDFRQAFFFGFNRIEYTSTIYAPNVPTLLAYSSNATQYDNDEQWYVNTPEYAAMLEDLGIDYDTFGYDPEQAQDLFDGVYDQWIADGNTGPITLTYLTSEGAESERIDNYIITHYETLFGNDKLDFVKDSYTSDVASNKQDAFEFDITLTGVGTGAVTNLSVMLPIIALFFPDTYGAQFGFNTIEEIGIPADEFIVLEENKIDLRDTWEYLKTVSDRWDETTDAGTLQDLFDILDANEGYFVGDLDVLFVFGLECTFIWAGLAPQYDGDVADRNTVTRAFDKIILEYAPVIPTAGRASSIVYAETVQSEWPAYHNIMEWGQLRYWYLTTDSDFE